VVEPATGTVLPPGGIGEVWLRGPSVASGYWNRPEVTAHTFAAVTASGEPGWLRTGDLGAVLDGQLYVTGRIKEMLIVRGRNLYPQDLEREARGAHPALAGLVGAAFGVAAPDERVVLVHEVSPRVAEAELPAVAAAITERLTEVIGVRAGSVLLVRRGSVLRTTSGKIERAAMHRAFLAGELPVLHARVERAVQRVLDRQPVLAGGRA
jgi:acyl-CoA synthetase (AMP-forming)/AMP-acid ligase II